MSSFAWTFDPSTRAAAAVGPNAGIPALGERVDEAGDERRLGADDHEVDRVLTRRGDERGHVGHRDREERGVPSDARVPGRAEDLRGLRRAPQRAHDGVLPPAAADHEDPHSVAMKSSIGIATIVSHLPVPREPSSSETRAMVFSSGASTTLTKS